MTTETATCRRCGKDLYRRRPQDDWRTVYVETSDTTRCPNIGGADIGPHDPVSSLVTWTVRFRLPDGSVGSILMDSTRTGDDLEAEARRYVRDEVDGTLLDVADAGLR